MRQLRNIAALLLAALLILSGTAGCMRFDEEVREPVSPADSASPQPALPETPTAILQPAEPTLLLPEPDSEAILNGLKVSFLGKNLAVFSCDLDVTGYQSIHSDAAAAEPEITLEKLSDFQPEFVTAPVSWELLFLDGEDHPLDAETADTKTKRLILTVRYENSVLHGEVLYGAAVTILDTPTLHLNALEMPQGGALIASLQNGADYVDYSVYVPHLDRWIGLYEYQGERIAVLPAGLACETGDHSVELYRTDASELPESDDAEPVKLDEAHFRVTAGTFDRQDLITTEETQSLYTSSNNEHDADLLRKARSILTPKPYFSGNFVSPLEGRRTTEFGMQRYVNGKLQSRHTGYDIGASEGTEIRAAESGVVTMAEELIVYGNTVVIDHGMGIHTSYSHMSVMYVDEGDYVERGAVIGLVGTTGYSTGPHLHYALTVQTYYTDPAIAETIFEDQQILES